LVKIIHTDLVATEGEPSARADLLAELQSHETELSWLGARVRSHTSGPGRTPAGIAIAMVQLSVAGAISGMAVAVIGALLGGGSSLLAVAIPLSVMPILVGTYLIVREPGRGEEPRGRGGGTTKSKG
jgi:hypothetical protein